MIYNGINKSIPLPKGVYEREFDPIFMYVLLDSNPDKPL